MEEFKKALNYAFLLLKYRARSEQEINRRLRLKRFSSEVVERVIEHLRRCGYIDDKEFVSSFVRQKLERGCSRRKIIQDARRLGIPEDILENELGKVDRVRYLDIIKNIVEHRKERYGDTPKGREKLFRYLLQRGFDFNDIKEVIDGNG